MQKYCKTIGALAAASALVAGNASAEVEYDIYAGYNTGYIFRGLDLGDDLVETGVTATTEWNGFGLKAGAWYGSFENNVPVFPGFDADSDELDITFEVSRDLGFATAAIGYIYYMFPQANGNVALNPIEDSQEIYFSVAKEFFGFDTSLTYFWEIEDAGSGTGGYLQAATSRSFELTSCVSLNTGAVLGYLIEEGDFSHFQVKVGLDWAFTETATLSPYVAQSWALSEDSFWAGSNNEFFGGAVLSVSF
jgi:hypothetical protein